MGHTIGQLMIFIVYLFAMLGIIVFAFFVWRKTNIMSLNRKKGSLKIEESLCLTPRKTLHIINVDNERLLIASDYDRTTLLTKLNPKDSFDNTSESKNQTESGKNNKEVNILQELIGKRGI